MILILKGFQPPKCQVEPASQNCMTQQIGFTVIFFENFSCAADDVSGHGDRAKEVLISCRSYPIRHILSENQESLLTFLSSVDALSEKISGTLSGDTGQQQLLKGSHDRSAAEGRPVQQNITADW